MAQTRPNILYIMPDQFRFDCLGCYGNPVIKTPAIDSLAQGGMLFKHGFVQNAVCMPSRSSMMTGRYAHEHGVVDNSIGLADHETTFMHLLSRAGYYTAAVGKMHMYPKHGPQGFQYLDLSEGKAGQNDNYRAYLEQKGLTGQGLKPKGEELAFGVSTNALPAEDYIDSYVCRKAIKFIDENKRKPFCLWLGIPGPHLPFNPPEPYDTMYDPKEVPFGPRVKGDLANKPSMRHIYREYGCKNLNEQITRKIIANYYGNITLIDEWVGKIVEALKRNGLYDNTLILFSSDHGELLGDHGLIWKADNSMYDSNIRVPFIVHFPARFKANRRTEKMVQSVDIMPTFLELAGVEIPPYVQGKSLVPILQGKRTKWTDAVFCEALNNDSGISSPSRSITVLMVRTKKWKYIYNMEKESFCELYDMEKDPHECKNLIKNKRYKKVVADLREKIFLWMCRTQSPLGGQTLQSMADLIKAPATAPKGEVSDEVIYAEP